MAPIAFNWRHMAVCDEEECIFKHFYKRFGTSRP